MTDKAKGSHAAMTAAVSSHFFKGGGKASGKGFPAGGDAQYNGTPSPFPAENGVGYTPRAKAGNRTK